MNTFAKTVIVAVLTTAAINPLAAQQGSDPAQTQHVTGTDPRPQHVTGTDPRPQHVTGTDPRPQSLTDGGLWSSLLSALGF